MLVYRITKTRARANDISGTGAFRYGGRWNSKGTYMLYTSETSSLAYLENLVHFDESDFPPKLFISTLEVSARNILYQPVEAEYPGSWQHLDNLDNKLLGDTWMREIKFMAFSVRSAVNPAEFNILLNPLFPGYHNLVHIREILEINTDVRLIRPDG